MVIGRKSTLRTHLAAEQPGRQGEPCQDAHAAFLGLLKQQLRRALAKQVVNDLHALHTREFNGFERLFDLLDADPIVAQLASLHHVIEHAKHFRHVENLRRRAVQLQQVDGLGVEVDQAALNKSRQVAAVVTGCHMGVQAPASLGGDIKRLAAFAAQSCQQTLTTAIAIHIGTVKKVHAQIERAVQGTHGLRVIDFTPGTPDGPGTKADSRDVPSGSAKFAIVHKNCVGSRLKNGNASATC
ncbi:hypothetical protein GALL_406440 [mine drainage metagenome]|uniref:Uncharacterized protein n=1 Tax=mine drainage metagenome TaxID=410659 RepID=A0A1J5Q2W7_9ZZZZ